jgi:hypothetical protein
MSKVLFSEMGVTFNVCKLPKSFYDLPDFEPGEDDVVECDGYISKRQEIRNFKLAGRKLEIWRRETYDYPDGVMDEDIDLTEPRAYADDRADMATICQEYEESLKRYMSVKERIDAEKKDFEKELPEESRKSTPAEAEGKTPASEPRAMGDENSEKPS